MKRAKESHMKPNNYAALSPRNYPETPRGRNAGNIVGVDNVILMILKLKSATTH